MPDQQIRLTRPFHPQHGMILPPEILSTIGSFLGVKDIQSARLVCRQFDALFSLHLPINTIYVSSNSKTLHALERSTHRFHITTIVYDPCYLPRSYVEFSEYYEDVKKLALGRRCSVPNESRCKKHWAEYRLLYEDQLAVRANSTDEVRITNALQLMNHIKHIKLAFDDLWTAHHRHLLRYFWSKDNCIVRPTRCPDSHLSRALEVITSAVGNRIVTLEHSSFSGLSPRSFSRELHRPLLSSLRNVELHFDETNLLYLNQVEDFLCAATQLEDITLKVPNYRIDQQPFSRLLENATWPYLRSISFQFSINYNVFLRFCTSHRRLSSLLLWDCFLFGGCWETLIEEIKSCLELRTCRLGMLSSENHPTQYLLQVDNGYVLDALGQYVIGNRQQNPFQTEVIKWDLLGSNHHTLLYVARASNEDKWQRSCWVPHQELERRTKDGQCLRCKAPSHGLAECPHAPAKSQRARWVPLQELEKRKFEGQCLRCGAPAHERGNCPYAPAERPRVNHDDSDDGDDSDVSVKLRTRKPPTLPARGQHAPPPPIGSAGNPIVL